MSKSSSSSSSSGIGFTGLLTIVFITLKLLEITAVAKWSWLWVLSPLWIGASIAILFICIVVAIEFWPKKKRIIEPEKHPSKKSRFMEKLDAAMEESRKSKQTQNLN